MGIRQVDKPKDVVPVQYSSGLMASPEEINPYPEALQNLAALSKFVMIFETVIEKSIKGGFDFVVNSIWKPRK